MQFGNGEQRGKENHLSKNNFTIAYKLKMLRPEKRRNIACNITYSMFKWSRCMLQHSEQRGLETLA